jgi:molybdopterin-guanine dinucleotide biosynthesis protein A
VIIQAGGKSSRMGQDKALLPFLGEPLIKRVMDRVARLAAEVLVTTNQPEGYRFLGVPLVADRLPERGALGGLYTALSAAHYPLVAVVACDMPFANPALLDAQRRLLANQDFDAVIPQTGQGQEPFHAVYRREACLPAIHSALQTGKWRADAWFDQVRLRYFTLEEILPLDPHRLAFWNVNTPEELRRAEEIARIVPTL